MQSLNLFIILLSLTCCQAKKQNTKAEPNTKKVFGNLVIALGEEDNNKVQCVAGFTENNDEGDRVGLGSQATVMLDSFALVFDPVAYPQYDTEIDTAHFTGPHTWTITRNNKQTSYSFISKDFKITSAIPAVVGKEDVKITCNALQKNDKVTLLISGDYTDHSETIMDIEAADGYFIISKATWDKIEGTNLFMHFNLSSIQQIPPDDCLAIGGILEATRVTRQYAFRLVR